MKRIGWLCILAVALLPCGCAAAVSITNIWSAEAAVHAARDAGAERRAPYELAAARAYLHQAREVDGYAQFAAAVRFARAAAGFAHTAATKAAQTSDPNGPMCAPVPTPIAGSKEAL